MTSLRHVYEVRPRKDKRGFDLIACRFLVPQSKEKPGVEYGQDKTRRSQVRKHRLFRICREFPISPGPLLLWPIFSHWSTSIPGRRLVYYRFPDISSSEIMKRANDGEDSQCQGTITAIAFLV